MKLTFRGERAAWSGMTDSYPTQTVEVTVEDPNLTEALETVGDFLKACGYSIAVGEHVDIIEDEV